MSDINSFSAWIQTTFVAGALGTLFFNLRGNKKELKDDIEKIESNYLTIDKHTDIDKIHTLEITVFIEEQNNALKDMISGRMDELNKKLDSMRVK